MLTYADVCGAGSLSRSAVFLLAYLMKHHSMSAVEAGQQLVKYVSS
jgi:protein-tyrosine phosphatase